MPLFGGKKKKEDKAAEAGYPQDKGKQAAAGAYPVNPSAPTYPTQAYGPPGYAGAPQGPPPAYTPHAPGYQQPPPPPVAYPQMQHTQIPPNSRGYYQTGPVQPGAGPTVVVPHAFDAGARFDAGATPNIPPPPPGCAPNAAQSASRAGAQVVLGQQKGDFLTGGSDGGYVWW